MLEKFGAAVGVGRYYAKRAGGRMFVGVPLVGATAAANAPVLEGGRAFAHYPDMPALMASAIQTNTLDITLDTTQLFTGAQTMIDALSSPYLLIAGFGLGVAILAAILKAVNNIRV